MNYAARRTYSSWNLKSSRSTSAERFQRAPLVGFDEHGDIPTPPVEISSSPVVLSGGDAILDDCRCFCSWKRFHRDCCRLTVQFLFSQIGLFVLVFVYIIFGGWMFSAIESRYEIRQQEQMEKTYSHGIDRIRRIVNDEFNWMLNASFELRYALWRGMLSRVDDHDRSGWRVQVNIERFNQLMEVELARMQAEYEKLADKHDTRTDTVYNQKWTYSTAVLYCATVVTTVGYGHIAPKSILGKLVTCLYAMIGIPIMITSLTSTGDLLAFVFIKYYTMISKWIKRRFRRSRPTPVRSSVQFGPQIIPHVPISATLCTLILYLAAGALLFSYWEGWSYVDGAYFSFITFTTIGLGDLVPGKGTLTENKNGKTIFCAIYLLFGLVLTAMCFKLMQDDLFAMKQKLFIRLGFDLMQNHRRRIHHTVTNP